MKIIPISGIISDFQFEEESNVTPNALRKSLSDANSDDVLITINSPGGSVFHGLEMFSMIKNYTGKTETRIISFAASMGSVLALAGQRKSIESTAFYYIHNAWGLAVGDYRELEKEAKFLKDISAMISELYAENTTLSKSEAQKLMDDESQFYGESLKELGFEIVTPDNQNNLSSQMFNGNFEKAKKYCIGKIKDKIEPEDYVQDLEKVAASISSKKIYNNSKIPASAGNNNNTEVIMNLEQLKKDHPELYAQVIQIGKDEEFEHVKSHITLGRQAGDLEMAVKNIEARKPCTLSVSAEYQAAGMRNISLQNRKSDDVNTGSQANENDDEADTQALAQKILKKRGVKNGK
jgi:ATP-dependent protease ClpP protease subunit